MIKNDKKIEGRGEEKPSSTKTRMRTSKGIRMDSLYGVCTYMLDKEKSYLVESHFV
jgi:hypothetical protein